jgi:[ribosomal protein S5]-alanine N-acetyltransferase
MESIDNLIYRIVHTDDSSELLSIWQDKDVIKYTMVNNINSIEDCRNRIERQIKWIENNSIGPFVVIKNSLIIGYCGGTKEINNEYEIFYQIKKSKWKNGYGTEIVKKLLQIAFLEKMASKVIAKAIIENIGSWKVLEKNKMIRDRTEKKSFIKDGNKFDLYVYEINKDEWTE